MFKSTSERVNAEMFNTIKFLKLEKYQNCILEQF